MEVPNEVRENIQGTVDVCVAAQIRPIASDMELLSRTNELRWTKTKAKELTEKRLSLTRPLDDSKKAIMALFAEPLEKLEALEVQLKASILTYEAAQAERRAQEQAAENERARRLEEAQKQRLLDEAEKAIAVGDVGRAETIIAKAEVAHVDPVNVATQHRAGTSIQSVWRWKVTDESKIPDRFWVLDEKKLNAVVKAEKKACEIDGIEVYEDKILAARGY